MKITDTLAVPAATSRAVTGSGQSDALEEKNAVNDRVSISSKTPVSMPPTMAADRAQRVQEIVAAVKSGQYYPSPQMIAQQLVSDAEVEARLRAMLVK